MSWKSKFRATEVVQSAVHYDSNFKQETHSFICCLVLPYSVASSALSLPLLALDLHKLHEDN